MTTSHRRNTKCGTVSPIPTGSNQKPTRLKHPPSHSRGESILEDGCMLTDGRLDFVFLTGEAVPLELPQRWSPVLRTGDLGAIGRC
ncbi:hypothetical protein GCO27_07550 [Corynebacterium sp. zg331]|nr:hypothetical protein [Corynebacterium sp. zg331]